MNKFLLARYRMLKFAQAFRFRLLSILSEIVIRTAIKLHGATTGLLNANVDANLTTVINLLDAKAKQLTTDTQKAIVGNKVRCKDVLAKVLVIAHLKAIVFKLKNGLQSAQGRVMTAGSFDWLNRAESKAIDARGRTLGSFFYTNMVQVVTKGYSAFAKVMTFGGHTFTIRTVAEAISVFVRHVSSGASGFFNMILHFRFYSAPGRVIHTKTGVFLPVCESNIFSAETQTVNVSIDALTFRYDSQVGSAPTKVIDTQDESFVFDCGVEILSSKAETLQFQGCSTQASSEADARVWSMPVLIDGILYIKQVYNAVQTGDKLEVI